MVVRQNIKGPRPIYPGYAVGVLVKIYFVRRIYLYIHGWGAAWGSWLAVVNYLARASLLPYCHTMLQVAKDRLRSASWCLLADI